MKKMLIATLVLSMCFIAAMAMAQQASAPTATPAAAPAAPAKAPAPAASLTIARMEIAGAVENREPVGIAASFPATQDRVSCFLEFQNVSKATTVNVVWTLGANEMGKVTLNVKPFAKFRTWANKTIGGMKGDWKVDVVDENGVVLKSATFKVE